MPEIVWDRKLYFDYFYERPIGLIFYTFLCFLFGFTRIFGDAILVAVKVKKFKLLSGLELITTLVLSFDIFYEIIYDLLFVEIFYHEFHSTTNCNIIHFSYQLVRNLMKTFVISIVILSKFQPSISRRNAAILIASMIFISTGLSIYFRIKYVAVLTRMNSDGIPHHICYPEPEHWKDYFGFTSKVFKAMPSVLMFSISLILYFWKRNNETQNRDTFHYGLALSAIFCIISLTYILRNVLDLGWGVDYAISMSNKIILSSNFLIYCYFHRIIFREACISLNLLKGSEFHHRLQEVQEE